jgi:hypothetical protein
MPNWVLRATVIGRGQLGDAEVEDLHEHRIERVVAQEDVGRLEVAVDDALAVAGGQRRRALLHDVADLLEPEAAGAMRLSRLMPSSASIIMYARGPAGVVT